MVEDGPTEAPAPIDDAGADCGADGNAWCAGGAYEDATFADAPAACAKGASCGGVCIDLQSDLQNCGSCQNACAGACLAARCLVTLVSGLSEPASIAVDAVNVYWSDGNNHNIGKAPIGGGAKTIIAHDYAIDANPDALAVDTTNVYWTSTSGLWTVPIGGAAPATELGTTSTGLSGGVALDTTHAYWSTYQDGTVESVLTSGGAATPLAINHDFPEAVAVDGTSVYWVDDQAGTVSKVPLGGGAVTVLASGQTFPRHLALDAAHARVYWTNQKVQCRGCRATAASRRRSSPFRKPRERPPNRWGQRLLDTKRRRPHARADRRRGGGRPRARAGGGRNRPRRCLHLLDQRDRRKRVANCEVVVPS